MKNYLKILITSLVIFILFVMNIFAQTTQIGLFNISIGYETFPSTYYYSEETGKYDKGWPTEYIYKQIEEDITYSVISLRFNSMRNVMNNKFSLGLETGVSLPLSGYVKEWSLPAKTTNFTGTITGRNSDIDPEYSQVYTEERDLSIIPILGKITIPFKGGKLKGEIGLGLGVYYLYHQVKRSRELTYVTTTTDFWSDVVYQKGDQVEYTEELNYSFFTPASELILGILLKATEDFSININGKVGLTLKQNDIIYEEDKDRVKTTWDPAQAELITTKLGEVFGGITIGINIGISYYFNISTGSHTAQPIIKEKASYINETESDINSISDKKGSMELLINPSSGTYSESVLVEIEVKNMDKGKVYYTIDNTNPDESSKSFEYKGVPLKIRVKKSRSFKFIAVSIDGTKSDVYSVDYIIE